MQGIGRVFKRKGSRFWQIEFWVRGKRHPESSRSTRKQDANELLMKRIAQYRLIPGLVTKLTVSEVLADHLLDLELRGARAMAAFRRDAQLVGEFLGHEVASDIDPRRLYELQQHLRRSYAPGTVNGVLGFLRTAYRHAARNGRIGRVPEFPRAFPDTSARQGFLEFSDYTAILKELPDWAQDPFRMLYYSGWRRNEVLSLRWDEVSIERRLIHLDPARSKKREGRTIPWMGEIPEVIARRLSARVLGLPFVFHRKDRRVSRKRTSLALGPSLYSRTFRTACIAAGRPKILIHDCRRTCIRDLIRAGVIESVARRMVGWKSTAMMHRYNITNERDLEDAAELYGRFMDRKATESRAQMLPFHPRRFAVDSAE